MEMLFVTDSDLVFNACDWTVCVNIYSTLQLDSLLEYQCTTLNIFKDCHLGYLNLKIYSPLNYVVVVYFKDIEKNQKF